MSLVICANISKLLFQADTRQMQLLPLLLEHPDNYADLVKMKRNERVRPAAWKASPDCREQVWNQINRVDKPFYMINRFNRANRHSSPVQCLACCYVLTCYVLI